MLKPTSVLDRGDAGSPKIGDESGGDKAVSAPCRLLAYYLPQFHPIPENDEWWGKGFTEWTNTAKAKPLYPGHYQPHVPADLGFYDLRVPESRAAQAEMARRYGIEGFCYYHYWFAGKRILERPFEEMLRSRQPDYPFCLCWANETWTGKWHGNPGKVLIEQTYPGRDDYTRHFRSLLDAFTDDRYVRVDRKPVFVVHNPEHLPDAREFTDCWRELALRSGLPGLHLVGASNEPWSASENGFDAATCKRLFSGSLLGEKRMVSRLKSRVLRDILRYPRDIYRYERYLPKLLMPEGSREDVYPTVIPNWDNTPRSGRKGFVFHGSTPELFRSHLRATLEQVAHKTPHKRIVFVKSWNEWAEGNHLEPDLRFGHAYLDVVAEELARFATASTERSMSPQAAA